MKWTLVLLFILIGCNSQQSELTPIQGLRDPADPFPFVTAVSTPSSGTYVNTNVLTFTVTFSEVVEVIGVPAINLRTEQSIVQAVYVSGSGTDTLEYAYAIPLGVGDADGIEVMSPLVLNFGGSIYDPDDDDDATLTFTPPDVSGILINSYTPALTAVIGPANGRYKENATMDFTVKFDFDVNVSGTPQLPVTISGTTYYADYVPTADKKNLTFRYTVPAALYDVGIEIPAGSLTLNGGTIKDGFGDNATITLAPTLFNSVTVDSVKPYSSGNLTPPLDGRYFPGQLMFFIVYYNEAVTLVSGSPRLALDFAPSGTRYATYSSGSGTSTLFFSYIVQAGDQDQTGGFPITYEQNGAVITDLAGNAQTNFTVTSASTANVLVDSIAPTIQTATGISTGNYQIDAQMNFNITFNENVWVAGGVPSIALDIGGTTKTATYVSGSGSTTLIFRYTVETGLLDNDDSGPVLVPPIVLNGATIKDGNIDAANDAILTHANFTYPFTNIDTIRPSITSVSLTNGEGSYKPAENLDFVVTYDDNITVVGTPYIDLDFSGTAIRADKVAATATTVTFRYVVPAGISDYDGLEFNSADINLNGGSIKDSLNNTAKLTLPPAILEKRLYIIPGELDYWFDVGDSLSASVVANSLQNFNSKAEPLTSVFSGVNNPLVLDDGVSYMAEFDTTSSFDYGLINADYIIIVYKTPPSLSSGFFRKLFTLGNTEMHFQTDGQIGLAECPSCYHFNGIAWVPSSGTMFDQTLTSYVWAPANKKLISLELNQMAQPFSIGSDLDQGEIAEIMILNSGAIPSSVFDEIYLYLQTKHGVSF